MMGAAGFFIGLIALVSCAPVSAPAPSPAGAARPEQISIMPKAYEPGLKSRVRQAIDQIRRRELQTNYAFWTVFHGILGLGPTLELTEAETGRRVNALDHICAGRDLRGMDFRATGHGYDVFMGQIGVSQGHQDQFIAEMAQWNMPIDRKFTISGHAATFGDFIRHCQMRARVSANQELSWAILVIAQYLGTDFAWTNGYGEHLRFDDLVRYELAAPVEDAACGGTHRLFGLTWAYHLHHRSGKVTQGVWADVVSKTATYRDRARQLRNPDGSFSTEFFRGPGHAPDPTLRINSTGHIFEWLALALTDAELRENWVEEAANALALMIIDAGDRPIEGGSLYHAVHGLLIYYARRFSSSDLGELNPPVPLPPGAKTPSD